jgi:hypothetical protein
VHWTKVLASQKKFKNVCVFEHVFHQKGEMTNAKTNSDTVINSLATEGTMLKSINHVG